MIIITRLTNVIQKRYLNHDKYRAEIGQEYPMVLRRQQIDPYAKGPAIFS